MKRYSLLFFLFISTFLSIKAQDIGPTVGYIFSTKDISNFQLGFATNYAIDYDYLITGGISYSFPNNLPGRPYEAESKKWKGTPKNYATKVSSSGLQFSAGTKISLFNMAYEDNFVPYIGIAATTNFLYSKRELVEPVDESQYYPADTELSKPKRQLDVYYGLTASTGMDFQMNKNQYINLNLGVHFQPVWIIDTYAIDVPFFAYSFRIGYQFYV